MIHTIGIKGFKSILDIQIPLRPINILIGANGSGKSNFISFFEFLDHLQSRKLQEFIGLRGGIEKFLHKGVESTETVGGNLLFGNEGNRSYTFEIKRSAESYVFSKEDVIFNGEKNIITDFSKESKLYNLGWPITANIKEDVSTYKKYHFHETGMKSPFNSTTNEDSDSHVLYSNGENLAPVLLKIRKSEPKIYNRIVKNIQSIAPFFSDFVLEPNETGYLKLLWQDKYSEYNYGVTDLSDGTIRFIAMAVLFMQPNLPQTIILDEPELGLHPTAVANLAGMISSAASRNSQVIVATQSADLISYFEPEDVIAVDQKAGCSIFNRLKREDYRLWLEEYSLGDLWQRNIINKGQPFETL